MSVINGYDFASSDATLVLQLVEAIEDKFGKDQCYVAENGLNFALRAAIFNDAGKRTSKGIGIYAAIRDSEYGVELRRPRIPKQDPRSKKLQGAKLEELMQIVAMWRSEVMPMKINMAPQPVQKGPFVAGGLPETDRRRF